MYDLSNFSRSSFFRELDHDLPRISIDVLLAEAENINYWSSTKETRIQFADKILQKYSEVADCGDYEEMWICLPVGYSFARPIDPVQGVDELVEWLDDECYVKNVSNEVIDDRLDSFKKQLDKYDYGEAGKVFYEQLKSCYDEYKNSKTNSGA